VQVEQRGGQEGSSSVVLFQANNGSAVMRFSSGTHVCVLSNMGLGDDDNDNDTENGFAVLRLTETRGRSNSADGIEGDDMFTDISMEATASHSSAIEISALLVMHDLAVPAAIPCAAPALVPSPILSVPRVLPPASFKCVLHPLPPCKIVTLLVRYVFSHNSRLKQGRQVRLSPSPRAVFVASSPLAQMAHLFFVGISMSDVFCLKQAVKRALAATLSSLASALSNDTLQESDPQRLQPVLIPATLLALLHAIAFNLTRSVSTDSRSHRSTRASALPSPR